MQQNANGLRCAWQRLATCRSDSTSPRIVTRFNARIISSSPTSRKSDSALSPKYHINSLLDLPEDVPPAPAELPAPYIDASQLKTYVWPLYSRQWAITNVFPKHSIVDGNLVGTAFAAPILTGRYHLSSLEDAFKMQQGIREIVASDKHEPRLVFRTGRNRDHTMDIGTFTHQCQHVPVNDHSTSSCVGPGISLHDVRFAIQTEKLYCTMHPKDFHVRRETPMSIEDILASHRLKSERFKQQMSWVKPSPPFIIERLVKAALPHEDASREYCTGTDFSRTIVPLYGSGWNIVYKRYHHFDENKKAKALQIPTLTGFYKFKSFEDAMSFAQDSMTTLEGQGCTYDILVGAQSVVVQPLSQNTEREITVRDARGAVMIEGLFTDKYHRLARNSAVQAFTKMAQPTSVEDLKLHPEGTVGIHDRKSDAKYARVSDMPQQSKRTEKAASALNPAQATSNSTA